MQLKLKDKVRWQSGASLGNNGPVRTGIVVKVIPPGDRPCMAQFPDLHKKHGCGLGRTTESYVVQVTDRLGKVRNFWPYAKRLEKV